MNKVELLKALNTQLRSKENEYHTQIEGIRSELANDSKSSAGDKYETSRAMAQQEIEQLSTRLLEVKRQINLLQSLPTESQSQKIEVGSLVITENGNYFIGIPFGTLQVNETIVYVISTTAPLAQQLLNKKVGDSVLQAGKQIQVLSIE